MCFEFSISVPSDDLPAGCRDVQGRPLHALAGSAHFPQLALDVPDVRFADPVSPSGAPS